MGFHFPPPDSNIRVAFPKTVIKEHRRLKDSIGKKEFNDRINVEGITIDGGERIIVRDDGINIIPTLKGGYIIQLHIADATEFITPDSHHFSEAIKRSSTVYRYRIAQHMFPRETGKMLSLEEGKTRPTITFEIELNKDLDVSGDLNIFPSLFKNSAGLNPRGFKKHFLSHGSELHDVLHSHYALAKSLLEKRVGDFFSNTDNDWVINGSDGESIVAYYVILREISRLINLELAKFICRNEIDFLFSQYQEGSFKYSTDINDANGTLTRVTSPLRRSVDLVLIDQVKSFVISDGKHTPHSHDFLRDLAIYFNNRSEYIDETIKSEKESIKQLKSERKTKSRVKSPQLLTEHDLQEVYSSLETPPHPDIEREVLHRCQNNLLGEFTLVKVFFYTKNIEVATCAKSDLMNSQSYVSFLSAANKIPDIQYSIRFDEDDEEVASNISITVIGYKYEQQESIPLEGLSPRTKKRLTIAVKRNINLKVKRYILNKFFIHKLNETC